MVVESYLSMQLLKPRELLQPAGFSDDYRYPTFTRRRVATTTRELVFATVEHANNACADIAADIAATLPVDAIQP